MRERAAPAEGARQLLARVPSSGVRPDPYGQGKQPCVCHKGIAAVSARAQSAGCVALGEGNSFSAHFQFTLVPAQTLQDSLANCLSPSPGFRSHESQELFSFCTPYGKGSAAGQLNRAAACRRHTEGNLKHTHMLLDASKAHSCQKRTIAGLCHASICSLSIAGTLSRTQHVMQARQAMYRDLVLQQSTMFLNRTAE